MGKNKQKLKHIPFVSICTPTFNRRPFIPMMLKCFEHQTYPKNKIEWLIVDDGTDKIEDLVSHIPQIKYFKFDEKMTLGKKRNFLNDKSKGEIIVYMDDDDYYPPERISHAVERLKSSPKALCAGSSEMFIYFKDDINKMFKFGPYGPNHATAGTFAFKRELLSKTRYDETSCIAEEKHFLKEYTIPFVQLDPLKAILVFSHNHNSVNKKDLLAQGQNRFINISSVTPADMIKEPDILKFFMEDIDSLLESYEPGKPEHKPDVIKQIKERKEEREKMVTQQMEEYKKYQETMHKLQPLTNLQNNNEQTIIIQQLSIENQFLKDKVQYLEDKIKKLIQEKIKEKMQEKKEIPTTPEEKPEEQQPTTPEEKPEESQPTTPEEKPEQQQPTTPEEQ